MSNTVPAVEKTITTVLDQVAPIVPKLAQKIPAKYRVLAYPLGGAALTIFNADATTWHVSDLAVWIVDAVASVVLAGLALGNTDISKG